MKYFILPVLDLIIMLSPAVDHFPGPQHQTVGRAGICA